MNTYFYSFNGGITIHDNKNDFWRKETKGKREVTLNWSCYGEQDIKFAKKFSKELQKAIIKAETMKKNKKM